MRSILARMIEVWHFLAPWLDLAKLERKENEESSR
jgi:hypothetical protein